MSEVDPNKFNTLISFYQLGPSQMAADGSGMEQNMNLIAEEYANLFQATPYTRFNGQQESIRKGTHVAQTRYRNDIDATVIVEMAEYGNDYKTIIKRQFIVNDIYYVGTDLKFMILDLSYRKDDNDTTN